jgi:hypothetical protein
MVTRIERVTITDYLTRSGWKLTRPEPDSGADRSEWWDAPGGQRISVPPAQGWSDQDARIVAAKIGQIDAVPPHQVMGTQPPFDPKSDPVLHTNGRGKAHRGAFADADDARRERHMKREHSTEPDRALFISGTATLDEAHDWFHYRFDH